MKVGPIPDEQGTVHTEEKEETEALIRFFTAVFTLEDTESRPERPEMKCTGQSYRAVRGHTN